MPERFKILSDHAQEQKHAHKTLLPEQKLRHFQNVSSSVLQDALNTWGDIWDEFQGSVTHGFMVTPEAEQGFIPECGWPEFLEKMWALKHYLDYAKRSCEGRE